MWGSIFSFPRSETLTLKKPRTLPKGQRRMCSALDLTDVQRVDNGEECYLSGCLWNSCDVGKMGRSLQFLDVDRESKAQILSADDVVIFMGSDQVFVHFSFISSVPHHSPSPNLEKIDFRADSLAYR